MHFVISNNATVCHAMLLYRSLVLCLPCILALTCFKLSALFCATFRVDINTQLPVFVTNLYSMSVGKHNISNSCVDTDMNNASTSCT